MILKLSNKNGIKLKTTKKYCNEDIDIIPALKTKQIWKNGDYFPPEGYIGFDKVQVNTEYKDDEILGEGEYWVRFVDFRGNIILEQRANSGDFIALPDPPEIEGYTFDGWASNMPIENGGITVNENNVYCGALYITSDGKTRMHLSITDEDMLTVQFCYYQDTENGIELDFGDGTQVQSQASVGLQTVEHTFPTVGDYIVTYTFGDNVSGYLGTSSSIKGVLGVINTSHLDYQKLITKMEYGRGHTIVSPYSFSYCINLEQINLPNGVMVGIESFYHCHKLKCLVIPQTTLTTLGMGVCSNCYSLEHLVIPYNYTKISSAILENTNIKRIALPNALISLGANAFSDCIFLKEIVLPNTLTTLEEGAFNSCRQLILVKWPTALTSIGDYCFCDCIFLGSIVLYNQLLSIGKYAFCNCKKISELYIPQSILSVGEYAFSQMTNLKKIHFDSHQTIIGSNALGGDGNLVDLKIPSGMYEVNDFLVNNTYLKSIKLPSTTLGINERFSGLKSLKYIDMQDIDRVPILVEQNYFTGGTDRAVQIWVKGELMYYYLNADVWKNSGIVERITCKTTGIENPGDKPILTNENHIIKLSYGVEGSDTPEFSVVSSSSQTVKINSYTAQNNLLSINLSSFATEGESQITVTMTVNGKQYTQVFKVFVLSSAPQYSIEVEDLGTGYNFELDNWGYYANSNEGVSNSICMSKIIFKPGYKNFYDVYAECYNSSQKNYDYGTISKINLPLEINNELDNALFVARSFYDVTEATETINLGLLKNTDDFVYLKYIKNAVLNSYDDTFKVKFSFIRNTDSLVL